MWVSMLAAKSDVLATVKLFQARVEVETGRKLRVLRTDNEGEFNTVEFETYRAKVWRHTTTHCAVHAPNRSLFHHGVIP
jgi:hypothetical protein